MQRPPNQRPDHEPGDNRYFFRLWLAVALLWTGATLLRVARVWVPVEGWPAILRGPWLWIELALPSLIFGLIIFAVRQVASNVRGFQVWGRRCRRR